MDLPAPVIMALGAAAPHTFRRVCRDAFIGSIGSMKGQHGRPAKVLVGFTKLPLPDILHQPWFCMARYHMYVGFDTTSSQLIELRRGGAHGCVSMELSHILWAKRIFHPPTLLMSDKWANLVELDIVGLTHEVAQSLCELRALRRVIVDGVGASNLQKAPDQAPRWELICKFKGWMGATKLPHHGYHTTIRAQDTIIMLAVDDPWAKHRTTPVECRISIGKHRDNIITVTQHGDDIHDNADVDVDTVLTFMRPVPDDDFAPTLISFWYTWELRHVDLFLAWLAHPIPCIQFDIQR